MEKAHIIYIPKACSDKFNSALEGLGAKQCYIGPTYESSVQRIRHAFEEAANGLQIYLAVSEGLMDQAQREAMEAEYPLGAMMRAGVVRS